MLFYFITNTFEKQIGHCCLVQP